MIRRDDSMKSFRLQKAPRPVGRPKNKKSFRLCKDLKSFRVYVNV